MRPHIDQYFIDLAALVSTRSTCIRRSVGCVLANERQHVLATGYNGRPAGWAHCNSETLFIPEGASKHQVKYEHACITSESESGKDLNGCEAIHAEQNALLQCRNVFEIITCYSTSLPCVTCFKLLLNTSCRRVVYGESYPHQRQVEDLAAIGGVELLYLPPRSFDYDNGIGKNQ